LREIKEANWEFAHRLFQCVSVASRPLRVEELAEFLAFDFKAGRIPEFHEDRRLEDPANQLLSTCSSLVSVVNVEGFPVIQFSHSSVKEFLTSTRLAETGDEITRRFHISMTPAHTLAAQACLGLLLHLDKNITGDGLQKFPLAKYAAKHWVDHARFKNVLPSMEDGMKQLFDPNKPHLAVWVWIYDPEEPWHRGEREGPSPPSGTPLHYAAHYGLDAMVKYLIIEHAQDVNARGLYKKLTPLHQASARGHVTVVRVLLEHDADVTAQNEDGSTPLHLASRWGRVKVVRVLLKYGADPTAQDNNRSTPLHQASSRGHVDSARVLLELGVDATAQDKNGWTPLHWASYEGHVGVTRVLLKHGVDATVEDKNGRTPLHRASFEGHLEITCVLLEHGVDATSQDKDGRTLLHRASFAGHVKVVGKLLEYGMDATVQDRNGWTPLHHASRGGHLEVVGILLKHGADATAKDKDGSTPSNLAFQSGYTEVTYILLENGKNVTSSASATEDNPSSINQGPLLLPLRQPATGDDSSIIDQGPLLLPSRQPATPDDSSSIDQVERAIKRVRFDIAAHIASPSTVDVTMHNSSVLHDAKRTGIDETHRQDDSSMQDNEPTPSLLDCELDDTSTSASEISVIDIESSDSGSIAQPTSPPPSRAADTLLPADQVVGAAPSSVTPEHASHIPRSQCVNPDKAARLSHVYTKSATSIGVSGTETASAASATKNDSSVDTSHEHEPHEKSFKSGARTKERSSRKVQVSDFEMMRVLGKGCAGKVLLVRHKSSSDLYALKAITKRHVLAHQELQHTLTEQAVLRRMAAEATDPFVVKLWWSFHDKENLFLVMVRTIYAWSLGVGADVYHDRTSTPAVISQRS
jgi:ankyrin repeat protein